MVPIFLLAISFLTAMRIWFSLGTFVNLLETKADRNHLFPRARRSPPQTRSSSFDLPWGIFATICSTKALRSNKWAGETPYNHKVRMKQQTSLKPCHISCQGSLFGVSFVCSGMAPNTGEGQPLQNYDIEKHSQHFWYYDDTMLEHWSMLETFVWYPKRARPHPRSSRDRLRRHVQHLSVALGTFKWSWDNIIIFKVHIIYK